MLEIGSKEYFLFLYKSFFEGFFEKFYLRFIKIRFFDGIFMDFYCYILFPVVNVNASTFVHISLRTSSHHFLKIIMNAL